MIDCLRKNLELKLSLRHSADSFNTLSSFGVEEEQLNLSTELDVLKFM